MIFEIQSRQQIIMILNNTHVNTENLTLSHSVLSGKDRYLCKERRQVHSHLGRLSLSQWVTLLGN